MTNDVVSRYRVDRRRVYAAGLSAGAAMTVIMGATYPDFYAAIGVSAGLEYRAAANLAEALVAQQTQGPDPDGRPLMEKWLVEEMRHAWSGGSSAGSYTDAKGPKASDEMWRFFRERRR